MPTSDNYGSNFPFASFRRSVFTVRNDQLRFITTNHDSNAQTLESFQRQVFACFHDLSVVNSDEFLSVSWMHKLLEAFTTCQEGFRVLLRENKTLLSKSPPDRLASEYFERTIKAMDIFNATRDGVETILMEQKHLDIVVCALDAQRRTVGEGQFRRARKALMDLAFLMLNDRETGSVFSHRSKSFVRKGKDHHRSSSGHSRSLSWSVSHSWSASKQLNRLPTTCFLPVQMKYQPLMV